jgi:cobalt/nickel transport system ATP-binding protein
MSAPLFGLTGIDFGYDPNTTVLRGLDFELGSGERVAVIGASGAGKTSLLHLMVGLLRPRSGRIVAFGRERAVEKDFHEVRARAGLVFQDADDQLFCPTVAEDVAFGPLNLGKSRAEARAIAERTLGVLGLDGFGGRVTHKLSGGEKRLVSLATVLAMEPEVLLLDEPTAGIDEGTTAGLLAILRGLPQAMVVVCHDRGFRNELTTRTTHLSGGILTPS